VRVLIAFYSLSGYTERLARATAAALEGHGVDLLEIVPAKPYSYFTAGIKGLTQAMAGTIVDLSSPAPAPGGFDGLVVLSPT